MANKIGLSELGEVSYNGYTFDGAFRAIVHTEFVADPSGRRTKSIRHTISVDAVLGDASTTDTEMADIISRLQTSGGLLSFKQKGFGNPIVVGPGAIRNDVMFGPTPKMLDWESLGGDKACRIAWQVVVEVSTCNTSEVILSITYEVDCTYDRSGNLVRVISGELEIANHARGINLARTPDDYRQYFDPPVPLGFTRERRYHFDKAKRIVSFTLTDTELASRQPYPKFATEIDSEYSARLSRGQLATLKCRLNFNMTLRADIHPLYSWLTFLTILNQRILQQKARGLVIILDEVELSEKIFQRIDSASISWHCIPKKQSDSGPPTQLIRSMVLDGAFWKPLGTTWKGWRDSMSPGPHHARGNSKWKLQSTDDLVYEKCHGALPKVNDNVTIYQITGLPAIQGLKNDKPPAETGYLFFSEDLYVFTSRGACIHQSLSSADSATGTDKPLDATAAEFGNATIPTTIVQQSNKAKYLILSVVKATRVGEDIPKIKHDTIGGKPVVELQSTVIPLAPENRHGVVVNRTIQQTWYACDAPSLGKVKPFRNPFQGVDDSGNAAQPS